ncbi:MAG: Leucine dehydrogenase [Pseudomonadota bacterium]
MGMEEDILRYAERMGCQELHMTVDKTTGLHAVVAIHNVALGPALGGCRCLEYPDTFSAIEDAIRLARGMTYKAAISNLPLGGGKAVLLKPKKILDRTKYFRAFGRFLDNLGGRYITAVDSGTSTADMDAISIETAHVTNTTTHRLFSMADPSPMTATGVLRGIQAAVKFVLKKNSLKGIHVTVQGLGHVGYALVQQLQAAGARITVFDINPESVAKCCNEFGVDSVPTLEDLIETQADVFAPCALGAIINDKTIKKLQVPIIAGAANNQLAEDHHGDLLQQMNICYAPDYVINAGGLIYVAGQYTRMTENESKEKVNQIYDTLMTIFQRSVKEKQSTHKIADKIVEEKLQRAP